MQAMKNFNLTILTNMRITNMKRQLIIFLCGGLICGCSAISHEDKAQRQDIAALSSLVKKAENKQEIQYLNEIDSVILKIDSKDRHFPVVITLSDIGSRDFRYIGKPTKDSYFYIFELINESSVRFKLYLQHSGFAINYLKDSNFEGAELVEDVTLQLGKCHDTRVGERLSLSQRPKYVLSFVSAVLKNEALPCVFSLRRNNDGSLEIKDKFGNPVAKCSNLGVIEYILRKQQEVISEKFAADFRKKFFNQDVFLFDNDGEVEVKFHFETSTQFLSFESSTELSKTSKILLKSEDCPKSKATQSQGK